MAGPVSVVFIMIARHTSAITIRELGKNKVDYSGSGEYTAHQVPHSDIIGRTREKACTELGFCLYWGKGQAACGFADSF